MKIKMTSVYVDDQSKALSFYIEVLGLPRRPIQPGPLSLADRGLARGAEGTELQLARQQPAAKAYQQAMFNRASRRRCSSPTTSRGYERIKARGRPVHDAPTDVTGSTICELNDTCGNLIQLTSWHAIEVKERIDAMSATVHTGSGQRGAQIRKGTERKWRSFLVENCAHSPEESLAGAYGPRHLREWAPFDADGSLAVRWSHGEAHHGGGAEAARYRTKVTQAARRGAGSLG